MNTENQGSESNEVGLPSTSSDLDMEDFVNVSDAASHVLSVLRDVRNSQHSSASRLSLELSNSFSGVIGRRRARRSEPIPRRGRGRRAASWRTHVVCLAQVNTTRTVTRSELERLTRAGLGMQLAIYVGVINSIEIWQVYHAMRFHWCQAITHILNCR